MGIVSLIFSSKRLRRLFLQSAENFLLLPHQLLINSVFLEGSRYPSNQRDAHTLCSIYRGGAEVCFQITPASFCVQPTRWRTSPPAPGGAVRRSEPGKRAFGATAKTWSRPTSPAGSQVGIQPLAGTRGALCWILHDLDVPGPMPPAGEMCPLPRRPWSSGLVGCGLLQCCCC